MYRQSRSEMENEKTLDGVLIWTDDAETDEYVQQDCQTGLTTGRCV